MAGDREDTQPRVETKEEKLERMLLQVLCRLEEAAEAKAINFRDYVTRETETYWRHQKVTVKSRIVAQRVRRNLSKTRKETYDQLSLDQKMALGLPDTWKQYEAQIKKEEAVA